MVNISRMHRVFLSVLTGMLLLSLCPCLWAGEGGNKKSDGIPVYSYRTIKTYPHDRTDFTQGLVCEDNVLHEGTGLYGRSRVIRKDLETGKILKSLKIPDTLFGEGITIFEDRIIQLTWKSGTGFVYDRESFSLIKNFEYPGQGWGITHDGETLIMSNGSAILSFLTPDTLENSGEIEVHDQHGPVFNLNELEYVNGEIYANIFKTDYIARIEPQTGVVTGWIDLTGLLAEEDRQNYVDCLNGIAYDPDNARLFVTGKLWPKLFEIELVLCGQSYSRPF
ncbi:MAG: glutaminyl-peptide cyclotransferase [Deltaproteobacteria bacterium]|nr:glutaminyl-peptide cyclotransferase [Deltaproteobacteria bacterium]